MKYALVFLTISFLIASKSFAQQNKATFIMEDVVQQAKEAGKPLMLIVDDKAGRTAAYSRFFKKQVWVIALYEKRFFKTVKNEFYVYFALSSNKAIAEIMAKKTTSDYPAYFFFNTNGELVYQDSGISDQKEKYVKMLENARSAINAHSK